MSITNKLIDCKIWWVMLKNVIIKKLKNERRAVDSSVGWINCLWGKRNCSEGVMGRIALWIKLMCGSCSEGVSLFCRRTAPCYPHSHSGIVVRLYGCVTVSAMMCLEDCVRQIVSNWVFGGVLWSRGWRVEVMELFAFCQPLTLISKPIFIFTLPLPSMSQSLFFCLWPFLRAQDQSLNLDHLLDYWFKV